MKEAEHSNTASFAEAERFLKTLDCTTDTFLFQVFDDLKSRRDRRLAAAVHPVPSKIGISHALEPVARWTPAGLDPQSAS